MMSRLERQNPDRTGIRLPRATWPSARVLSAAVLLAGVFAGSPGWSAEAEPEAPAQDTSGTSKPAAEGEPAPSGDVFIPTEDISEDFAVSFPVDI